MAKLYWRIKKNGKWTWRACSKQFMDNIDDVMTVYGIEWKDAYDLCLDMEEE